MTDKIEYLKIELLDKIELLEDMLKLAKEDRTEYLHGVTVTKLKIYMEIYKFINS